MNIKKVAQSCKTLWDPMDYRVHGLLQARSLEWIAVPFSRRSSLSQGSNPGHPHCSRLFTSWATREALLNIRLLLYLSTVNNAVVSIGLHISFWISVFVYLGTLPKVVLLYNMVVLFLVSWRKFIFHNSMQFSHSVVSDFCSPIDCRMPGLPVHHQIPEFNQTHVHWVSDDTQPSHPLTFHSPPALNLSQHQGLFKWVSSLLQVAKVLEFQLQHQSFQWTPRTDLL